jgi:CheY-like chemotaxis protein
MKRNCSILLVEDDADDVYFITRALRNAGLNVPVETVNNGQLAVDFLTQASQGSHDPGVTTPCLVLLDLNLPHRSGLEVLRWIRTESNCKTILVIVLTSSTSEIDMHQAYSLGANSYVLKPSDATRLDELAQFLKDYWFGWNQSPPSSAGADKFATPAIRF